MKAANDAEPNSLPQSQEQKSDSEPGLDGRLVLAMSHLTIALAELTEGLTKQAEAISQLAMSNEALADAVTSQPDEGEEQESGYLS